MGTAGTAGVNCRVLQGTAGYCMKYTYSGTIGVLMSYSINFRGMACN